MTPDLSDTLPTGPFDPPGVTWQPVSQRLVRARLLVAACTFVVPVVGAVVLGLLVADLWSWVPLVALLALAVWVVWLVPRQVRAMGYAERGGDLLIRKGILFRRMEVIPYGRIQYLDVERGPIARWQGIATLQLHTASATTDATIPGLGDAEAERLRDHLASKGGATRAGV